MTEQKPEYIAELFARVTTSVYEVIPHEKRKNFTLKHVNLMQGKDLSQAKLTTTDGKTLHIQSGDVLKILEMTPQGNTAPIYLLTTPMGTRSFNELNPGKLVDAMNEATPDSGPQEPGL